MLSSVNFNHQETNFHEYRFSIVILRLEIVSQMPKVFWIVIVIDFVAVFAVFLVFVI